jgi:hypothetical protein
MTRRGWVVLGGLLLSAPPIAAQDSEEPCRPVTAGDAREVAQTLGLAPDQEDWLLGAVQSGTLREPEDLEGMPGLGPELRDALTGSFCWSSPWSGSAEASARMTGGATLREARLALGRGGWEVTGRVRRAGDLTAARGAFSMRFRRWTLRAGTLRARRGLGLALVTPGAEPRGHAPLRESRSGWRPTLTTNPDVLRGVSLEREGTAWWAAASALRGPGTDDAAAASLLVGEAGVRAGSIRVETFWLGGNAGPPAAGARLGSEVAGGLWCVEWARSGEGSAQAASWHVAAGTVRVGLSLSRLASGFRIANIPWYRAARTADRTSLRGEGRWSAGPGRFVRLSWDVGRTIGARDSWPERRQWLEVELGERIRPRLSLRVLWRRQSEGPHGAADAGSPPALRRIRAEVAYRGAVWICALDARDLEEGGGCARMTSLRVGRLGPWRWELRAALVRREPGTPVLWWYRRRAGSQYGWDAPGTGTWVGIWVGRRWRQFGVEASLDRRAAAWDLSLAVRWGIVR